MAANIGASDYDVKNISLGKCEGTVHLNILSNCTSKDSYEIAKLRQKLEIGQQTLIEMEAINQSLINEQTHLQLKIPSLNEEVQKQEALAKQLLKRHEALIKRCQYKFDLFGLKEPDDIEKSLGMIKHLGPAYDKLCDLCEKQRDAMIQLAKDLEMLAEEKKSFSWKDAVAKEQFIYDQSEGYINTLVTAFEKCNAHTEKQAEKIEALKKELDDIGAENEDLSEVSNVLNLEKLSTGLDLELKDLLQRNQDLERKNNVLTLQGSNAPSKSILAKYRSDDNSLNFYKQKCQDLQSQLNKSNEGDSTLLDITLEKGDLSSQVGNVKQEVQGLKAVLAQSKQALQDILNKPESLVANQNLNKSLDSHLSSTRKTQQKFNRSF